MMNGVQRWSRDVPVAEEGDREVAAPADLRAIPDFFGDEG
jgi:hypothetical protein